MVFYCRVTQRARRKVKDCQGTESALTATELALALACPTGSPFRMLLKLYSSPRRIKLSKGWRLQHAVSLLLSVQPKTEDYICREDILTELQDIEDNLNEWEKRGVELEVRLRTCEEGEEAESTHTGRRVLPSSAPRRAKILAKLHIEQTPKPARAANDLRQLYRKSVPKNKRIQLSVLSISK